MNRDTVETHRDKHTYRHTYTERDTHTFLPPRTANIIMKFAGGKKMSNGGSGLFNEVNSVSTMDVIEAFGIDLGLRNNKALCPFHEENHASFHVFEKNWHCFGCQAHGSNVDLLMKMEFAADALAAANLIAEKFNLQVSKTSRTKVTMASYAKFTNLPDDYLMEHFFLRETNKGVEMPYINEECEEVTYQLRRGLEKRAEGKKDKRFEFKAKAKTILYGLWNIEKTKQQDHVLLVEGASDVQVCWYNQVPCLGAPGANGFKDECCKD